MALIGGQAGYATVEGPQRNYVGEAMQNVENSGFRYREEKNALNEQKKREERILREEQNDELKDALAFDQKYKVSTSGIQSVDTKIHDVALKLKQLYAQGNQEYKSAKTNDQKTVAYQKMSNSMSGLETLKQFPEAYNASTETLTKGLEEGVFSEASSKRKAAELDKFANGQYVVDVDDRGNVLFSTFDMDENGKVSKVKSKDLTAQQMLANFNPTKSFNIDGTGTGTKKGDSLIKIYNDNIGKPVTTVNVVNGVEEKKQYYPNSKELAKTMANEAVQDMDKLYELFDRLEIDPENPKNYNNPDNIAKAATYLENILNATAPEVVSKKKDFDEANFKLKQESAAETKSNNAKNRQLKRDEINTETVVEGETVTPYGQKVPTRTVTKKVVTKGKQKETPAKKTISRGEIASKAKAAGYSTKEYEALLVKNGITIKN